MKEATMDKSLPGWFSEMLSEPGTIHVIEGNPGSGRTMLAIEIAKLFDNVAFFIPSVARELFNRHHACINDKWLNDSIFSGEQRTVGGFIKEKEDQSRDGLEVSEKRLVVIRCHDAGNLLDEILDTFLELNFKLSNVYLLLTDVAENPRLHDVASTVIGLREERLSGRAFRILELKLCRGHSRRSILYPYTLTRGRFYILPPFRTIDLGMVGSWEPSKTTNGFHSTGSPSLDEIFNGGLRLGTFNLFEVDTRCPDTIYYVFLSMVINFLKLGHGVVVMSNDPSGFIITNHKAFMLYVEPEKIHDLLKIFEETPVTFSESRSYVVPISKHKVEYFNIYPEIYDVLSESSGYKPVFSLIVLDPIALVDDMKYTRALSSHVQFVKRSNSIEVAIVRCLPSSDSGRDVSKDRVYPLVTFADAHVVLTMFQEHVLLYGVKTWSPLHAMILPDPGVPRVHLEKIE